MDGHSSDYTKKLRCVITNEKVGCLTNRTSLIRALVGAQFAAFLSCFIIIFGFIGDVALARETQNIRKASRLLAEEEFLQAYALYKKEAKDGDPVALFTLGLFELNGWGRPQHEHVACEWFQKAADLDVPMATLYMGDCLAKDLINDTEGKLPQYWYKRAIDLGLPQGWCSLGKLYLQDKFVPYDLRKAVEMCEKSAESGDVSAQVTVAKMILHSPMADRNMLRAIFWLEQASVKGDKEAQFLFAEHLVNSGKADSHQGLILQLYQQSALQGYQPAYGPTGQLNYEIGLVSESQDDKTGALGRAYFWLLLLQNSGNIDQAMKYKDTLEILSNELEYEQRERISLDVSSQEKYLEEQ